MKTMKFFLTLLFLPASLFLQSCGDDDDPVLENEEELITDVILTLTPSGGGTATALLFNDPDGEIGSTAPIITGGTLQSGTTYVGAIVLLNNAGVSIEDITIEVKEEGEDHLFCYTATGDIAIDITDKDAGGLDLGIVTTWTVGSTTGASEVELVLKHQPGVKNGDCDPGDTDIEIVFPITIE
jgi:hypothetical protein